MRTASYEFIDPEKQIGSEDVRYKERLLNITSPPKFGWHYIIDLAWIYGKAKLPPREFLVFDIGGGNGLVQCLLAGLRFNVIYLYLMFAKRLLAHFWRYQTRFETVSSFTNIPYSAYTNQAQGPFRGILRRIQGNLCSVPKASPFETV
ncbi:MAG: hypothetical protein A3J24_12755 [Deltaproteobacteria bacterium RIFCSPLOWO2_02_FULL_53_8]|nr:MAG: hypothetical protein A3J24_12755 [Deltaproteobacteria bacterium RIFCSPLOWO2_02_FULL_53_8]